VPQEELVALLEANDLPIDALRPDCNVSLWRGEGRLVLFDVGAGHNFMDSAGQLFDALSSANIDPADVTDVVFTHAHPDHLWGLTDDFDDLVFANAAYHIGQTEWDYWNSPDTLSQVPESQQSFVVGAQNRFAAIKDQVNLIMPGDEVLPGIEALDTGGHTPGHMSFVIHGTTPVMVLGDALSNHIISVEHPDWPAAMDQDSERAIRTRRSLLDRAAGDGIAVIGYHFPNPGLGHIERKDGAYRYVAV
jgi:glyoxylase-like metal-dependent hydrolase (beta-lactamase superfamily II)